MEESEAAYSRFAQYIDHIKSLENVRFVTATDLPTIYVDRVRKEGAKPAEVDEIVKRLVAENAKGVDFVIMGPKSFSPADQFEILAMAEEPREAFECSGLMGPDGAGPAASETPLTLEWAAYRDALMDVRDFIRKEKRVPARIFIGPDAVRPEDFLVAMARAYVARKETGQTPAQVTLGHKVELLTANRVAKDTPGIFGGWVIHKENFRAPKILEVARWQAWTLKPAMR
jgi:hypothetical protein